MNALVTTPQYHAQLPAFLRDPKLFAESDKAVAGIGGSQPPYVSIKGAKFALVDAGGETLYVQQMHLDVIVLTGNEHVSKMFYAGAYDPAAGAAVPPTCFSDNGIAPSYQASLPQHSNCASCKFNAWGSKVTPTGSQVKACTDSKKLAIVLAADTPYTTASGAAGMAAKMDQVYLLKVPAASMSVWRDYAKDIRGRGVPIIGVITRMTFNPQASFPALLFAATGFISSEAEYNECRALLDDPAVADAVGANDRPTQQEVQPQTAVAAAPAAPAPAVAPLAPAPVMTAPAQQAAAVVAASAPAALPAARRRGRPAAGSSLGAPLAPAPAAAPAQATMFAATAAAAPGAAPVGGTIQAPTESNADLDALLAKALA